MQILGRRGRKKWKGVLSQDHLSFDEIKQIHDQPRFLSDRESIHLTRCRHCRKIAEGIERAMFLLISEEALKEVAYTGCGI